MTVKAKFKVEAETINEDYGNKTVAFRAVTAGSEENKSFAKYTPSGTLIMSIDESTSAYDYFVDGKEYYLTFEAAE